MSKEQDANVRKILAIRGEPHLEPRPGDKVVDARMLQQFGLFNRMKRKFSVEKLPGSILLRSYRQGDVVFQQGQAGGTAFYIPTDVEVSRLKSLHNGVPTEKSSVGTEKEDVIDGDGPRQILSAMIFSSVSKSRPRGILERLLSQVTKPKVPPVTAIPSDGPTDIDYETREAPLMEGDLFGELSCISFTPRSATVIARVDCQLVEFTRSVFDRVREDPNHVAAVEEKYRRRTLETHLRQFELFRDLSDSQIQILKNNVSLDIVRPGKVICEEHEVWSDSQPLDVFVVRNGIVQVSINTSLSLRAEEILDWPELCRKLNDSEPDTKLSGKSTTQPELLRRHHENPGTEWSVVPNPMSKPANFGTELRASEKSTLTLALVRAAKSTLVTDFHPVAIGKTGDCRIAVHSSRAEPVKLHSQVQTSVIASSKLSLLRKPPAGQSGGPKYLVKSWMNDRVLETIRQIASEELQDSPLLEAQQLVLQALNELMGESDFLSDTRLIVDVYTVPELVRKIATFPKGLKGIRDNWSELELRSTGRTALGEIFPDEIRRPKQTTGPPRVLGYLSRGDCFGEIAVVRREIRTATCIAYNHPSSEEARDFGNVELVRIKGSAFRQLMDDSPKLKSQVEELAEKRVRKSQTSNSQQTETDLMVSTEFQQMGLFQGTNLLVIDLNSCTRCGDCVDACVKTHDDGHSRLFLDGPRYDRFLVPSACRNCLNPVCMIGCPVGSIGRGESGQIEIADWCIGCSICADQCPYDSIQMHDVGLIPEESRGWLFSDSNALSQDWHKSHRLGGGWKQGKSPFLWQGELLQQWSMSPQQPSDKDPLHLYFRHEFRLPKKSSAKRFRLSINDARRKSAVQKNRVKTSKIVSVWLNGQQLELLGNSIDLAAANFLPKVNLLAIEVALEMPADYGQIVLSACLDAIPEASKLAFDVVGKDVQPEMDLVTRRATVCDLCSHIPGQQPACVSSCPHDAAIRINPLVEFPR